MMASLGLIGIMTPAVRYMEGRRAYSDELPTTLDDAFTSDNPSRVATLQYLIKYTEPRYTVACSQVC